MEHGVERQRSEVRSRRSEDSDKSLEIGGKGKIIADVGLRSPLIRYF